MKRDGGEDSQSLVLSRPSAPKNPSDRRHRVNFQPSWVSTPAAMNATTRIMNQMPTMVITLLLIGL